MTRRERLEHRLEKRRAWAESRERRSATAFDRARAATAGIPFGQPILVGHHSERGHRRALERSDNAMRAACESADMAKHHESKAAGLAAMLDHAIFSDDADAPERIRERIAELEESRAVMKAGNAAFRKGGLDALPAVVGDELTRHARRTLELCPWAAKYGGPFDLKNLGANIRRLQARLVDIERRTKRAAEAEAAPGGVLIRGAEYVNVTFAEKPDRAVLDALKAAGFAWCSGTWGGYRAKIPACVLALAETQSETED